MLFRSTMIGYFIMKPLMAAWHLDANVLLSIVAVALLTPILSLIYFGLMKLLRMEEVSSLEAPMRGILRRFGIYK